MRGGVPVPPRIPVRQLFVVVERESAAIRMRLAPSDQGERFAVENQGIGIVPIEFLGDGERGRLSEAYHLFRRLEPPRSSTAAGERLAAAFAAWKEALGASGIDVRVEREALYGLPLPRNVRAADGRGISLRPWDIELTAIEARLRQVVKFDRVPATFTEDLRQEVAKRGLLVEIVRPQEPGTDDAVTLIVSRDAATLAAACELEQRLLVRGGDPGAGGAAAAMGELLGYPTCCVNRFARIAEHNDSNLAWALLPGMTAPASPLTEWLQPGLALLSHSPCALDCTASIELGRRLLDAVEAKEPGFAARWHGLAARVQVVDQHGNRLALAVDGSLQEPQRIAAADLLGSGGQDPDADERAARLVGKTVRMSFGGLVIPECDWYAPYVADHRGG